MGHIYAEEVKNTVGNNIRRIRLLSGLTQEELALSSGLSQAYINQLENGKRNFTQKSLERIAKAMSTPIAVMFEVDGTIDVGERQPSLDMIKNSVNKKPSKKAFLKLINELPDDVVAHYFALMSIEKIIR